MVKQVITPNIAWCPPAGGELKFNFDGATVGSFGQYGIGAKILAFHEACLIYRKTSWAKDFKVIFKIDSSLVADWLMNPQRCPLTFKPLIASCLEVCKGLEWKISHVSRTCNTFGDILAKKGISRSNCLHGTRETSAFVVEILNWLWCSYSWDPKLVMVAANCVSVVYS
ncbi:hypothetical protein V6N12_037232 [Hibiscus sabdariffa]|uniref:RNase H type-1 domain-containing protein n=1 Tax=Hibiscus sabdariffa TaxID=183260 RepID=A0ABR2C403_9ROSI